VANKAHIKNIKAQVAGRFCDRLANLKTKKSKSEKKSEDLKEILRKTLL